MKTWKFGIIGAGNIAAFHAKAIADLANAQLMAICDNGSGRAKSIADEHHCQAYSSFDDLLASGLDLVCVATPSGLHLEPVVAAAESGIHVICEKPLEITLCRIDAMIAAHEKAGTQLGCIFQNRFTPAMTPLREAIAQKRFGRVTYAGIYVPWWREEDYYGGSGNWRGTWKTDGGGAMMNQSIHMVDMLVDLLPEVESLQAFTDTLAHPQIETEDSTVAILRFGDQSLGIVHGSTGCYPGHLKRFELMGTEGSAIYLDEAFSLWQFKNETDEDERIRKNFGQSEMSGGGAADPTAISHSNHTRIFAAFLEALENNTPFHLDAREARKAVQLVLALYQAGRDQKPVKFPQP